MAFDNELVLSFSAKLISDYKDDGNRDFLLQYYMQDQTMTIFEEKKKMNGFKGGRFLNKMKVINPQTGKNYTDSSLAVGNILQISGRTFELEDAPEYTLCLMESNPKRFLQSDMQYSIELLAAYADKHNIDLNAVFEEKDVVKSSVVSSKEAEEILFSFSPDFPKQCAITILRRLTYDDSFDYLELVKCVNFKA